MKPPLQRCLLLVPMVFALSATVAGAGVQVLQSTESIRQAAEDRARRVAQQQGLQDIEVSAHRIDRRLQLALCNTPLETSANTRQISQRVSVSVRCTDKPGWRLYVPVKVSAYLNTVTLRHSVPRGTILTAADLSAKKLPVSEVRGAYLGRIEDAVGKSLRRAGRAGKPLHLGILESPPVLRRGQETDLLVGFRGVEVKMQGTALANGSPGDLVKVKNVASGKTLEGIVTPEGWVRIP